MWNPRPERSPRENTMRVLQVAILLGLTTVSLCESDCSELLPKLPVSTETAKADQKAILDEVNVIKVESAGNFMSVFGSNAFPLLATTANYGASKLAVGAGGRSGKGRMIGFANNYVFIPPASENDATSRSNNNDHAQFLLNIVKWLAGGKNPKTGAVIGGDAGYVSQFFQDQDIDSKAITFDALKSNKNLNAFDFVLVIDSVPADSVPVLKKYLDNGGGLGLALSVWLLPDAQMFFGKFENFPPNLLSKPFGFVWQGITNAPTATSYPNLPDESYDVSLSYLAGTTLPEQWNQIQQEMSDPKNSTVMGLIPGFELQAQSVPKSELVKMGLYNAALKFLKQCPVRVVTLQDPAVSLDEKIIVRLFDAFTSAVLEPKDVTTSASSKVFPGYVSADSKSSTFSRTLTLNKHQPEWISTGLYAPNGEVIVAKVEGLAAPKTGYLMLQIGCHSDNLAKLPKWHRPPTIVRKVRFFDGTAVLNNPHGGNIYVYTMNTNETGLGPFKFTFQGAVPSPYFKLGETTLKQWQEVQKKAPGAWAELESKQVIITIPSSNISKLDDPESLLKLWDKWTLAEKELMGSLKDLPERAVSDVQISAGALHAGYPMMGHLRHAEVAVDLPKLKAGQNWGWLHEIGHNLQDKMWTFKGTVDMTNNVLVVYALDTISGISRENMNNDLDPEKCQERLQDYLDTNVNFEKNWLDNHYLGLQYYLQLQKAFGWSAYKKTFATYNALPKDQRPKTEPEKIALWIELFSKSVGQNLINFHKSWGFPIGKGVADKVKQLPMSKLSMKDLLQ